MNVRWLGAAALAGAVAVAGGLWLSGQDARAAGLFPYRDAAAVARGAEVYAEYCASCHGADLEGEPNWRDRNPDGTMPAPPHDETGHTWHHPDVQLFAITKQGIEAIVGGDYRSSMIGFGDVLSDTEILEVLGYIKSTWPEEIQERHDALNRATAP
ncbi:cytochrome c [Rhodobacteraceae bacterium CCMM004]|nr:cytochrome c [Rhodobacteraceae bacterium CCMM004]